MENPSSSNKNIYEMFLSSSNPFFNLNSRIEIYQNEAKLQCVNEYEIVEKISRGLIWKVIKVRRHFYDSEGKVATTLFAMKKTHIRTQKNRRYYSNEQMVTYFDKVLEEIKIYSKVGENINKKIYVPCNYSRGIIARSLAYMKYTYPLLNLSNVIDNDVVILWNELYPPTELELKKNNIIYKYQGNKNIFIEDYKMLSKFINNNFN